MISCIYQGKPKEVDIYCPFDDPISNVHIQHTTIIKKPFNHNLLLNKYLNLILMSFVIW